MNKKSKLKKRLAAGALIAGMAVIGSLRAGAGTITVQNSDFSNYAHTFVQNGNATNYGYAGVPADWTISSGGDAFVQPGSFNYAVLHNDATPFTYDGLIIFGQYAPTTVVSQTTAAKAQVGDIYTLTTQFFVPWFGGDQTTSDNIALTIGGVVVAENTDIGALTSLGSGDGEVANITLTYKLTDSTLAGEAVGIELLAPATATASGDGVFDTQYLYDNVSLDAVPEPGTWALLVSGLFGLLGLRRIRRRLS